MPSTPHVPFTYQLHESVDEHNRPVTTIYCHGRLVSAHSAEFKELVKPLIAQGGRILLNFSDFATLTVPGSVRSCR